MPSSTFFKLVFGANAQSSPPAIAEATYKPFGMQLHGNSALTTSLLFPCRFGDHTFPYGGSRTWWQIKPLGVNYKGIGRKKKLV